MRKLSSFLLLIIISLVTAQQKCKIRQTGKDDAKVCVCDENYCDTLPRPRKLNPGQYVLYTSNKAGQRFQEQFGRFKKSRSCKRCKSIEINQDKKFQKIVGFGGAFTDATGINIRKLNAPLQDTLLKSYFSEEGIEYNFCRVPIAGTDFGTHPYTYDDSDEPDPTLEKFSLAEEDHKYKIHFMKKALKLRKGELEFFGSPWGAPTWMKTNRNFTGYGFIEKEYYQVWADYFLKFLEQYEEEGIKIWGITTQNEPSMAFMDPPIKLVTVGWSSLELAKWLGENLGPTIRNSKFKDTKILILDDQKTFLPWYVNSVLDKKAVRKYVDGIAIHWYRGKVSPPSAIEKTHENFPDLMILSTEACNGFEGSSGVDLGSWGRGEDYSTDIIEDLGAHVCVWVDWNMVLNTQGGPTYIDNFVDSPIVIGDNGDEFYKQPMYYHLGHFSKFLLKGSVRVESKTDFRRHLMVVAFKRPDDGIVVNILNRLEQDVQVAIIDEKVGVAQVTITKRSINSFLYWSK